LAREAYGDWLPWVKANCEFTISTANFYMKLAEQIASGDVISSVGDSKRKAKAARKQRYSWKRAWQEKRSILSVNINRRHLTKGQRAMALATLRPEAKMGRSSKDAKVAKNSGVSQDYVRMARVVLQVAPELADGVRLGTAGKSLEQAYETAQQGTNLRSQSVKEA
jgi:hypothetical protein